MEAVPKLQLSKPPILSQIKRVWVAASTRTSNNHASACGNQCRPSMIWVSGHRRPSAKIVAWAFEITSKPRHLSIAKNLTGAKAIQKSLKGSRPVLPRCATPAGSLPETYQLSDVSKHKIPHHVGSSAEHPAAACRFPRLAKLRTRWVSQPPSSSRAKSKIWIGERDTWKLKWSWSTSTKKAPTMSNKCQKNMYMMSKIWF